jgi:hypothetical protein
MSPEFRHPVSQSGNVHTAVGGKENTLYVRRPYCTVHCSVGCGNGYSLHAHTAGGGNGYTLHVYTAGVGGGDRNRPVHIQTAGSGN